MVGEDEKQKGGRVGGGNLDVKGRSKWPVWGGAKKNKKKKITSWGETCDYLSRRKKKKRLWQEQGSRAKAKGEP